VNTVRKRRGSTGSWILVSIVANKCLVKNTLLDGFLFLLYFHFLGIVSLRSTWGFPGSGKGGGLVDPRRLSCQDSTELDCRMRKRRQSQTPREYQHSKISTCGIQQPSTTCRCTSKLKMPLYEKARPCQRQIGPEKERSTCIFLCLGAACFNRDR
jgi:hypothetical protein